MHPYDKFKSDNPVPERSAFDLTELNRQDIFDWWVGNDPKDPNQIGLLDELEEEE